MVGSAALPAQVPTTPASGAASELVMEIFTLRYRPASDAIERVEGLLSTQGTLELKPSGNTLVVRDTAPTVRRILDRLRQYDQPLRRVRLEIQIVRAGGEPQADRSEGAELSSELVRRLRELLRFERFSLLAQAALEMKEGEEVAYQFDGDYRVEFQLGAVNSNRQLRLGDFMVGRGPASEVRPLIHTNLNLTLDRPMVLGLAQTEASDRALMVVLTSRLMEEAAH